MASVAAFTTDTLLLRRRLRSLHVDGVVAKLPQCRSEILLLVLADRVFFERAAEVEQHRRPLFFLQLAFGAERFLKEPALVFAFASRCRARRLGVTRLGARALRVLAVFRVL